MKFEFISDLDEYFCEQYANYDKICVLPGYRMPKMQDTREDEFGRKYSYTLPAKTMSLANQEKKAELLSVCMIRIFPSRSVRLASLRGSRITARRKASVGISRKLLVKTQST